MNSNGKLVEVRGLKVWFGSRKNPIRAVDGVSFEISGGLTVALVGESGCGKSVTALSLARLVPQPPGIYAGGTVLFDGRDVMDMTERELANIRGRELAYVFQEPGISLNPVFRVGYQIMEAVKLHKKDVNARDEVLRLMNMVGLPEPERRMRFYPHEMSGGMQQRVMIAMALACSPKLLVADEPTTALDVTIQAQILELMSALQKQMNMSVLLITHNLGLVADTAHFVYVMYAGRIVESGTTENVLAGSAHPYTKGLLDAVPRIRMRGHGDAGTRGCGDSSVGAEDLRLKGIPGSVPDPACLPKGCKFAPRCSKVQNVCREKEPEMMEMVDGKWLMVNGKSETGTHQVRCYFPD
ncbi:ABC transporter ATP-binding protein [Verrucomicrobiota bacterium]